MSNLINTRYTEQDWQKFYLADKDFEFKSDEPYYLFHKPTNFLLGVMRGRYVTHNWSEIKDDDYLFTAYVRNESGGVSKCGRTPYEAIKILTDFLINHTAKEIKAIQQKEEDSLREYAKFKMLKELLEETNKVNDEI